MDKIKNKLMNMSLSINKRDFTKELEDIESKVQQLHQEKTERSTKMNELKNSLKTKKVKSVKEQREELEKELKGQAAKINNTKKKISHLEVQIE
jgi:chromosome segregation ATPase